MFTKLYVTARNWHECDEGATAVEYGLMVAAIAVAILAHGLPPWRRGRRALREVQAAIAGV